jgi:hypothetical protein
MPVPPLPKLEEHSAKADKPAAGEHRDHSAQKPAGPHPPVALITVTVLVMLLLAGLATVIYLTSSSS